MTSTSFSWRNRVTFSSTRCPCCFSWDAAWLWWDLSHLSMTCLSRPAVHPSCPEVLVPLKSNKKTFLYSSCFICLFPPPVLHLHILSLSPRSLSVLLSSIKGSLYSLYKRIGVVNRCRVMGYLHWQADTQRVSHPSFSPPSPAILLWWIAPTIHLNYVTGNELSVQSGPNEALGLFLLTLPQHSLLLLITVRRCRSRAGLNSATQCPSAGPCFHCHFTAGQKLLLSRGFCIRQLLHEPRHAVN